MLASGDPGDYRFLTALGAFVRHIRPKAPNAPISPASLPVFRPGARRFAPALR